MNILNIAQFEKLNIDPITINDLSDLNYNENIIQNIVKDIDGNSYDGVKIGDQIWMASNLRTTKFSDGSKIDRYYAETNPKKPYYRIYPYNKSSIKDNKSSIKDFGCYYNFACIETGNLAPLGWHVPTIEEWQDLFAYIAQYKKYNLSDDQDPWNAEIAKSICSNHDWQKSMNKNTVGKDLSKNNSTGFGLYPSGYFNFTSKSFGFLFDGAICLSSEKNKYIKSDVCGIFVKNTHAHVDLLDHLSIYYAFNVRCVKDN